MSCLRDLGCLRGAEEGDEGGKGGKRPPSEAWSGILCLAVNADGVGEEGLLRVLAGGGAVRRGFGAFAPVPEGFRARFERGRRTTATQHLCRDRHDPWNTRKEGTSMARNAQKTTTRVGRLPTYLLTVEEKAGGAGGLERNEAKPQFRSCDRGYRSHVTRPWPVSSGWPGCRDAQNCVRSAVTVGYQLTMESRELTGLTPTQRILC